MLGKQLKLWILYSVWCSELEIPIAELLVCNVTETMGVDTLSKAMCRVVRE